MKRDLKSKEAVLTRSKIMRAIRRENTRPELAVRRALHAMGLRFRLHRRDLPGTPDIVLPKHRRVVLVHGCFWHQHSGCQHAKRPKSRPEYWLPKLARNVDRDGRITRALKAAGWHVTIVWECETKDAERLGRLLFRRFPIAAKAMA